MSSFQALSARLSFTKLTSRLQERLRGAKPLIMAALPAALEAFYTQVRATPETARFFASEAALRQGRDKQFAHWDLISNGRLDETYGNAVTHLGETHAKIGLEPRWYIGGYAIMLEHLLTAVLRERWPQARFGKARNAMRRQAMEEICAIAKVTLLDLEMATSVYLESAERTRLAAETKAKESAAAVAKAMRDATTALAAGDLTHRIGDAMPAEYAMLRDNFNTAMEKLSGALSGVLGSSRTISAGVDELAQAADDMARRTEHQAASLLQSTTALGELTAGVKNMASGTAEADKMAGIVNKGAENSRAVVAEAGSAMGQIEGSSREIGQIIGLIDDIAFQTNLLALNAGVEAARAGDAGRGFAVVASEVRALAQRSADAAKAIKALISTSSTQVNQGVDLVRKTSSALDGVIGSIGQIDTLISGIATAAASQSSGLGQVNEALGQMNNAVQQNAAMVEETTAAVHSLRGEIDGLTASLHSFKLPGAPPSFNRLPAPARRRIAAE